MKTLAEPSKTVFNPTDMGWKATQKGGSHYFQRKIIGMFPQSEIQGNFTGTSQYAHVSTTKGPSLGPFHEPMEYKSGGMYLEIAW